MGSEREREEGKRVRKLDIRYRMSNGSPKKSSMGKVWSKTLQI